jgi:hypothetical protein
VVNAGQMWSTSCAVKTLFTKETLNYRPDLIFLIGGWEDLEMIRRDEYQTRDEYCFNGSTFLNRTFFYAFIKRKLLNPLFPAREKEGGIIRKPLDRNLKFFAENMSEIIVAAEEKNILIGLISLPAIHEKDTSGEKLKSYPKLSGLDLEEIRYQKKFLESIDYIFRRFASRHLNFFYI